MTKQFYMIFDGHCPFCLNWVRRIKAVDRGRRLQWVDLHEVKDFALVHPCLTREMAMSRVHLVEGRTTAAGAALSVATSSAAGEDKKLYGGFDALRRLCLILPPLYLLIPVLYFPGMRLIGPVLYRLIARNRYLFHSPPSCPKRSPMDDGKPWSPTA